MTDAQSSGCPSSQLVRTQREAARELGVSDSTLCLWLSKGAPRQPDGIDVEAVHAWRAQQDDPRDGSDLRYWKQRKARADALAAEDKLARSRRELIGLDEHDKELREQFAGMMLAFQQAVEQALPRVLAAQGGAPEGRRILRAALDAALEGEGFDDDDGGTP